jgi:hypothetical protein
MRFPVEGRYSIDFGGRNFPSNISSVVSSPRSASQSSSVSEMKSLKCFPGFRVTLDIESWMAGGDDCGGGVFGRIELAFYNQHVNINQRRAELQRLKLQYIRM